MEKVWKRLIAVSLSLMLMFTMGLNVFAAENVDGTPSDDPAVTLDKSDAAATDVEPADEAVVQDEAPAEEAVVQEDEPEVAAMDAESVEGEEATSEPEVTELAITNNTGMFKAVTASLITEGGQEYLVMSLSGTGYHELFMGTYEDAVNNGDGSKDNGNDTWIHGYQNSDGKWEFQIPVSANKTYMPVVAISDSYYNKYLNQVNSLERAFYPRQITLDRDAKTLVTEDYEYTQELTLTNNVKMFKVNGGQLHTVGGPNSNNYAADLIITMGNDTFGKMYVGRIADAETATETIALGEGNVFTVPVKWVKTFGQPETMETLIGEPFIASFYSTGKEQWYEREITVDEEAGTLVFNDVFADYTAVDAALSTVPNDLSIYTEESASAVTAAVEAVVRDKKSYEQAAVDAMAQAIEDAVKALRVDKFAYEGTTVQFIKRNGDTFGMWSAMEGSTFTYSDEQIHISIIPSNSKKTYSWMHWGGINEELTKDVTIAEDGKIVLDLSTDYCGWAVPVAPIKTKDDTATTSAQYYLAIPALECFTADADYTAVDAAIAAVPENLSIYTEESAAAVTEAVNAVVRGKKAVEQDDVDRMAKAIDKAVKALKIDISDAVVEAIPAQTYTGAALTPDVNVKVSETVLNKDTDYTVEYANNMNVGQATVTVTGKGNYGGTKELSFTIDPASINDAVVSNIPAQTYTGKALTPAVTLTIGDKTLVENTDYTVAYAANVEAGTATVTLTGKGGFIGSKSVSFTIKRANQSMTVKTATKTLKVKKLKKKARTIAPITVKKQGGAVTYSGVGTNAKAKKALKINAKTGKITVKKKTKKGTYKMKVTVKSAASNNYNAASKTVIVTVKVKK